MDAVPVSVRDKYLIPADHEFFLHRKIGIPVVIPGNHVYRAGYVIINIFFISADIPQMDKHIDVTHRI
jgi:hypothetical protein